MNYRPFLTATLFVSLATLHAEDPASLSDAGRWSKEQIQTKRPAVVTPPGHTSDAKPGAAPSDAIVFFDGTNLSQWTEPSPIPPSESPAAFSTPSIYSSFPKTLEVANAI